MVNLKQEFFLACRSFEFEIPTLPTSYNQTLSSILVLLERGTKIKNNSSSNFIHLKSG